MTTDNDIMSKEEAARRVRDIARRVYANGANFRVEATFADVNAFHVVQSRLNALAMEYASLKIPYASWPPYYPIITDGKANCYVSCNYFWKWVNAYLALLERITPLKPIADLHRANMDFAERCQQAWRHLIAFYGQEGERLYPAKVQEYWDQLQMRQMELFEGMDNEDKPE